MTDIVSHFRATLPAEIHFRAWYPKTNRMIYYSIKPNGHPMFRDKRHAQTYDNNPNDASVVLMQRYSHHNAEKHPLYPGDIIQMEKALYVLMDDRHNLTENISYLLPVSINKKEKKVIVGHSLPAAYDIFRGKHSKSIGIIGNIFEMKDINYESI